MISPVSLRATALLLCASAAHAGNYGTQNFSAYAIGATSLGDATTISSNNGTASVQGSGNRFLRLTRSGTGNTSSAFKLPDLDPGKEAIEFTLSFDLQMSTSGNPADGCSVSFGAIPVGHGGGESGFAMDNGLVVAWDTYNNGGDPQSIEVFSDGISVGNYPQTFSSVNNVWAPVAIHWDSNGLDVSYNGASIVSNLATPGFAPSAGDRFAFSGRTGGATQNTYIDDVQATTVTATPIATGGPIINEFVTDNTELDDDDLDTPDWIEIYNGQNATANLAGYYLTDDPLVKTKWQFPAVTMAAYDYLLVFASGKDRTAPANVLHTNFTLPKIGGYLALVGPDGSTIVSEFNYAAQAEDIAYGELGHTRTLGYLETPTPGEKNSGLQAAGPPAEDVLYDRTGGVFNGSVTLAILPPLSPTATVRYTTDDTVPHAGSTLWTGATFNITDTTTVRARVFEAGRLPGEVKSRTFLELANDIASFNSALPIVIADSFNVPVDSFSSSGNRPFRRVYTTVFERDPVSGLASVTDVPDFTGRGGMHVRGQSSSGFPKKQYAWEAWDNADNDKNVSILGMPSESDWILHAPYSDKTLMRNVMVYSLARQLRGDGGGMRTRFVELFFNQNGGTVSMADYRGVYVVMEKIKRDKDRVDIEKLGDDTTDPALITGGYIFKKDKTPHSQPWNTATEGVPLDMHEPETANTAQFNYLRGYVNAFEAALHGSNFDDPDTGYAAYIDTLSFIDNHLFVECFKEIDGYRISQYFTKDRDEKIRALPVWDYNLALGNANYLEGQEPTGWYYTQLSGTNYYWYQRLFQDTEFDLAYWDRFWNLRRSIFTDAHLLAEIDTHDAELDLLNSGGQSAVTRNYNEWNVLGSYLWPNADGFAGRTTHQSEVDWMKTWLTDRMAWIETQSRGTSGLAQPPSFNQYGGDVPAGFNLTMTNPNSWAGATIYYTTDGSDPRVPGNGAGTGIDLVLESAEVEVLVPSVANGGSGLTLSQWTEAAAPPNAASWIAGSQGVGYDRAPNTTYDSHISTDIEAQMDGMNQTAYIRIPFTASAADVAGISTMTLRMKYDDGFVAYLNGVEIAAANDPVSPVWDSGATASHNDTLAQSFVDFNVSAFTGDLVDGANVLAIHALNRGVSSSDALWTAELVGQSGGGDAPSATAAAYSGALSLSEAAEVKARVYDGSKWSPLSSGLFLVAAVPASASNLVISEFDYRPASPSQAEIDAGFLSRGDFEYIELTNIDPVNPVSLEGVTFSDGVTFAWDNTMPPEALVIPPGGRVVLVDDPAAFALRHGGSGAVVAGTYSGSLSNDGELITLLDAGGSTIKSFTYNDVEPWPVAADGDGYSLVLIDPFANPDHNAPASWRSSAIIGGTPGGTETIAFTGDPDADDDGDGQPAFLEYALGSTEGDASSLSTTATSVQSFDVAGVIADHQVFEFPVNLSAGPLNYIIEGGTDLEVWFDVSASMVYLDTTNNGDGTATVRYRLSIPFDPDTNPRLWLRLTVTDS